MSSQKNQKGSLGEAIAVIMILLLLVTVGSLMTWGLYQSSPGLGILAGLLVFGLALGILIAWLAHLEALPKLPKRQPKAPKPKRLKKGEKDKKADQPTAAAEEPEAGSTTEAEDESTLAPATVPTGGNWKVPVD